MTITTGATDELAGYRPRLLAHEGRFFFQIPELGLLASGATVQAAYDALAEKRAALLAEARAADLLDELPPPASGEGRPGSPSGQVVMRADMRGFLLKTAIVVVALALVALPVSWSVGNALSSVASSLKSQQGLGRKLERELERAARPEKAMDPARQAELLAQLRVVVSRFKPFVDELTPLFAGPGACTAATDPAPPDPS